VELYLHSSNTLSWRGAELEKPRDVTLTLPQQELKKNSQKWQHISAKCRIAAEWEYTEGDPLS